MTVKYRIFEEWKVAILVTFLTGFINAYTYNTQGGRFAGAQTGNIFMMMIFLVQGEFGRFLSYTVPVFVFVLGQFLAYFMRLWIQEKGWRWHAFSGLVLLGLVLLTAVISPFVGENVTIGLLALFSSLQLETFKRIRDVAYANIMMTGNLKNGAIAFVTGLVHRDWRQIRQAVTTYSVILAFMVGVCVSTMLTTYLLEYTLYLLLFPLLLLNYWLQTEKPFLS